MKGILCVETATEACSLALYSGGRTVEQHKVIPRKHNVHLFAMLEALLPQGGLREQGIDAIAYGAGPGSFTGLRIAASFAQGLAFSSGLPAIPLETLGIMAQTALREGLTQPGDTVLVTLDARINEVYGGLYEYRKSQSVRVAGPWVSAPAELTLPDAGSVVAIGSGCRYQSTFPTDLRARVSAWHATLLPHARDMVLLAQSALDDGRYVAADAVLPVYVQEEISWKKISEQGQKV